MKNEPQITTTTPSADIESDGLQCFGEDDFAPFYDEPPEARNVGAGLSADRKLILSHRHILLQMEQVQNVATTLGRLPAPGESYHLVCRGNWPAWALIPAFIRLGCGATIDTLHIATLGFSRANGEQLLSMLDDGLIHHVSMAISCYFKSNESGMVEWLAHELKHRGHRFAAVRNHAKVIAVGMTDGSAITVESSANLRSCRNVEQFTITNNADLLKFHQQWIDTVLAGGDEK